MEVLRSYSQIVEKTKQVLDIDISETPMLDKMSDDDLEFLSQKINLTKDYKKIGELSELIFQLNDYVYALCNYVKIFLYIKNYDAIVEFLSKLFASHIGNQNFQSKQINYTFAERFFDRFIEVVKISNISPEYYLPLIFESICNENANVYIWKQPALEYMQNEMRENEDIVNSFIEQNKKYQIEYIKLILQFNTQKGISLLFNNNAVATTLEKEADTFFKQYITDTINYFDKNLPQTGEKRFHYIKIMASIKNNVEIEARLEKIYEDEHNLEIRTFLAERLGITEVVNFGTELHFEVLARKKVEFVQERSLGYAFANLPLHFASGKVVDNVVKTYLINVFKEEPNLLSLSSFSELKNIFNPNELENFADKIWSKLCNKDDICSAKWCIRMASVFCSGINELSMYEYNIGLYKTGRNKEAKYLTSCLIASKKKNILDIFNRLENIEFFELNKQQFIEEYASVNKIDIELVKDIVIGNDLTEFQKQNEIMRLYNGFLSGRKYNWNIFKKLFISKSLFNEFAQSLVFGEYKLGALYSLFIVEGKEIRYIFGNKLASEDSEPYVMIVHPLDMDERFERINIARPNPLFTQFFKSGFDVKQFNRSNFAVTNLSGMLVNGERFVYEMSQKGFIINKKQDEVQFSSMLHTMEMLNMFAEVEFEKPITSSSKSATLGAIRFYRISNCMKDENKYITNKSNCLTIGAIPERYFDYILNSVQNSIKN